MVRTPDVNFADVIVPGAAAVNVASLLVTPPFSTWILWAPTARFTVTTICVSVRDFCVAGTPSTNTVVVYGSSTKLLPVRVTSTATPAASAPGDTLSRRTGCWCSGRCNPHRQQLCRRSIYHNGISRWSTCNTEVSDRYTDSSDREPGCRCP